MNSTELFNLLNDFLASKGIYALVLILFFLGMFGMIVCKNYMKKLMSMNIMQVSIIFFFLCFAQKEGGMIPVLDGVTNDPWSIYKSAAACAYAHGNSS